MSTLPAIEDHIALKGPGSENIDVITRSCGQKDYSDAASDSHVVLSKAIFTTYLSSLHGIKDALSEGPRDAPSFVLLIAEPKGDKLHTCVFIMMGWSDWRSHIRAHQALREVGSFRCRR